MKDVLDYVSEVLEKGYLMSLATSDTAGLWVADVAYVHQDLNIYWASHPLSRHSRALERNSSVAGCITLTQRTGEPEIGLQFAGHAKRILSGAEEILELYQQKKKKADFTIPLDFLWYVLQPELMDLLYEPVFGKKKQKILPLRSSYYNFL